MDTRLAIVVLVAFAVTACGAKQANKPSGPPASQAPAPARQSPTPSNSGPGGGAPAASQAASQPGQSQPSTVPTQPASQETPGTLAIENFAFLQEQGGAVRPDGPYKPGETVYMKATVVGLTADPQGKVDVKVTQALLDPNGTNVYSPAEQEVHGTPQGTPAGSNPKADLTPYAGLPAYAPPGTYTFKLKIHDVVQNTDAELTRTFAVETAAIAPATQLELRDLQLSLSENGPPATRAVVHAGQTVFGSAKVMGMKFDGDRPNVHISLQVIAPDGSVALDKPDFFVFNDAVQYRPAAMFATISTQVGPVPPDMPKGVYTEKYDVTDKVANTTAHYEAVFEVQ